MSQSFLSKMNKPFLILFFVSVFIFGVTTAFFTLSGSSPENTFASGSLELNIAQDTVLSVSDWKPGEIHILEFQIQNTGSLASHVKGYLAGSWDAPHLDTSMFEIVQVERKVNDTWIAVTQNGLTIGEEFFLSADGTENTLLELEPNVVSEFRLTTRLSETTPNEYQNQSFVTSLHVAGKQTNSGADWPEAY